MSIEINDVSTADEIRWALFINDNQCAMLTKKNGDVQLNWQVYGPQYWPQAKELLQGLLELSVLADKLAGEKK